MVTLRHGLNFSREIGEHSQPGIQADVCELRGLVPDTAIGGGHEREIAREPFVRRSFRTCVQCSSALLTPLPDLVVRYDVHHVRHRAFRIEDQPIPPIDPRLPVAVARPDRLAMKAGRQWLGYQLSQRLITLLLTIVIQPLITLLELSGELQLGKRT